MIFGRDRNAEGTAPSRIDGGRDTQLSRAAGVTVTEVLKEPKLGSVAVTVWLPAVFKVVVYFATPPVSLINEKCRRWDRSNP